MPNPIAALTTARLIAEAITPLHFHDLHRLNSEPKVVKTLASAGKPLTEAESRERMEQAILHWRQQGFGLWVFHRKSDGAFIGRGGIKTHHIDGKDVLGLAYAVMPDYWNRGFATEIATASVEVGFEHLGFPESSPACRIGSIACRPRIGMDDARPRRSIQGFGKQHLPQPLSAGSQGDVVPEREDPRRHPGARKTLRRRETSRRSAAQ
jgi:RimJ/RimL family protein N-acetyltransferase